MLNQEHRFQVREEEFGTKSLMKLLDVKTGEFVSILPYLGGSVNQMVLNQDGSLIDIIDGYISNQDADENLTTSFKGSNLFPFPNRIADGKYSFNNEFHQLPLNFPNENNAIHGLVFDQEFIISEREDGSNSCMLVLTYEAVETAGYPFRYLFQVKYHFRENTRFDCEIKVKNIMSKPIPVGHGWHPYFKLGNEPINNLVLQFPAETILKVDKRNIPTGESTPYDKFNRLSLISDTRLDDCFRLSKGKDRAEILIMRGSKDFGYKIWQETGKYKYNYLQVYTPPHRKSIAIEPMTCIPNAFVNKEGLIILAPEESFSVLWGIDKL
jgi:aldose 1-epimerase